MPENTSHHPIDAFSTEERDERLEIARSAAVEADQLAALLANQLIGTEGPSRALHSMARRISRLACVVISVVDDEMHKTEAIRAIVEDSAATA